MLYQISSRHHPCLVLFFAFNIFTYRQIKWILSSTVPGSFWLLLLLFHFLDSFHDFIVNFSLSLRFLPLSQGFTMHKLPHLFRGRSVALGILDFWKERRRPLGVICSFLDLIWLFYSYFRLGLSRSVKGIAYRLIPLMKNATAAAILNMWQIGHRFISWLVSLCFYFWKFDIRILHTSFLWICTVEILQAIREVDWVGDT